MNRILLLRWMQRGLAAVALAAFGYCAFIVSAASLFQQREQFEFDRLLLARQSPGRAAPPAPGLVGRVEIDRLGLSAMISEGTTSATLRRAVGHITGTALPGRPGNVGLSAHRDTFFWPLRNVRRNDVVKLTTLSGEYRYRVVSTKIVDPGDLTVLDSSGKETLTLVTCYPFYFIGPAPERFIVTAQRF